MKTVCCLLLAVFAVTHATLKPVTLTKRQLDLQQFLVQAHKDQQLEAILQQMMFQNGNVLPKEIEELLEISNLPKITPPPVVAAEPEKSKYKFAGMEKLSANELRAVNVFLDEYFTTRDEQLIKFQPRKLNIRTPRQSCRVDDDCPYQQFCFDVSEELFKDMSNKGYSRFYKMVMVSLDLKTKECSPRFADLLVNDVESYMKTFRDAFEKIKLVVEKSQKINGMKGWIDRVEKNLIKPFNFSRIIEEPLAEKRQQAMQGLLPYGAAAPGYPGQLPQSPPYQQAPQYQAPQPHQFYMYPQPQPTPAPSGSGDSLSLLLPLMLMGGGGGDQSMQQLLPLLLLMGGDSGGSGGGLSPLLLISVMGMGDNSLFSSGNNMLTILMLTQFMGSGTGGMDSYLLPLILLMTQDQANTDNSFLTLLPLLLAGGDLTTRTGHDLYCPPGGSGQSSLIQILLLTSLLNVNGTGSGLSSLLPILLLQPQNGCSGSGSGIGITEILLLQSMSGGGNMGSIFTGGNSLLPLLVLSGLGTGGTGSIDPALLLLVLNPSNNNNSTLGSLLPILFLSDPNFAQDPLAFLLLFNGDLFGGGSGGGTNNMNLLFLLLFLGQGTSGYSQPITSPYGITQPNPNIPQPGGPPPGQVAPAQGGLFGGLGGSGGSNGIFTLLLLTNLTGGGAMGSETLLLLLLLSGNSLF